MLADEIEAALGSDISRAEVLCARVVPGSGAREASLIFETAYRLEQASEYGRAVQLYRLVAEDPAADDGTRINAVLRQGLSLVAMGETEAALPLLGRAATSPIGIIRESAVLMRLHLLALAGRWEAILAETEGFAGDAKLCQSAQLHRVQARARLGTLAPQDPLPDSLCDGSVAYLCMSAAFAAESTGFHDQACELYQMILRCEALPPGLRTNAHYRLGTVLDTLYRWSEAEEHLNAAIECPDPHPQARMEAMYRLGNLFYLTDDFDRALPVFGALQNEAGASTSLRADAKVKYGTALFRLGRKEEAWTELTQCREHTFGGGTEYEVKAELLLAEIAEGDKDFTRARECYARAVRHPSSDPLTKAAALARSQQLPRK